MDIAARPSEVAIQHDDFDIAVETAALREANTGIGAVATFTGVVRDSNEGEQVATMELEHYPGMTEKQIAAIIDQARERWQVLGVKVIHRIGLLRPGEQIVFVGVCSAHRGDAFAACEFIMDFLKTRAPFWKKEKTPEGDRWVEARDADEQALERWQ